MRMHAQTAIIENGLVRLPETAPWLAQYLHELTAFPKGRHDDQVDSTAQFLDWFKRGSRPSSNAGIWHLYKSGTKPSRPVVPSPRGPTAGDARHPPSVVIVQQEPKPNGEAARVKRQ